MQNLIGRVFGYLTVESQADKYNYWNCRCSCGTLKQVRTDHLSDGGTKSCGCQTLRLTAHANTKHGMSKTPIYSVWAGMRQRCTDQNTEHWEYYGGRGIAVAPEWEDFSVFYSHVGDIPSKLHTLDRIDNSKGYCPGNVRWATSKAQGRNKRNNLMVSYRGESLPLSEWCESLGLNYQTIYRRIKVYGWATTKALEEPVVVGGPTDKPKRQSNKPEANKT